MTQSSKLENENASLTKLCEMCNRRFEKDAATCPEDQSSLIDLSNEPMFGRALAGGKYTAIRELGRGGMGSVYLAEDNAGHLVAVKLFKAQLTDKASASRFQEDAAAWLRLQHPHLPALIENMVDGKQPCLVVEYVHGKSLHSVIKEEGTLAPERCLAIFTQAMDALKYAHDNGVLHRDLKPGNIILTKHDSDDQYVKVVDFMVENLSFGSPSNLGLADLVSRGPVYMSPEQCQGKKLSEASDIYSLGVALYEGLVGKPPFKGRNSVETASMQISTPAPAFSVANPNLTIHPAIEQVTLRALEKDPAKRFSNMAEFKSALTAAITSPDTFVMPETPKPVVSASSASIPESSTPAESTKKFPVAIVAAVAVVVIGGGIAVMMLGGQKPETISFSSTTKPNENRVIEGTVLYVALDPVIVGKQKAGYRLKELNIKTSTGEILKLTANVNRELNYAGPEIGVRCRAAIEGASVTKLKVVDADPNLKNARDVVLEFVKSVSTGDWAAASGLFTDKKVTPEILAKDWAGTSAIDSAEASGAGDRFSDAPMPQALKVITYTDEKTEVLLNEAAAFKLKNAIDKFTLIPDGKGSWKIEALEQRIPRKDWHGS